MPLSAGESHTAAVALAGLFGNRSGPWIAAGAGAFGSSQSYFQSLSATADERHRLTDITAEKSKALAASLVTQPVR